MRTLLILLLVSSVGYCHAQQDKRKYYLDQLDLCGGLDSLMKKRGEWKKHNDANMISDRDLSKSNARIDAIAKLFREAYPNPVATDACWYRTMSGTAASTQVLNYNYNSLYHVWYCNHHLNKLMLGTETGTWAYAFVNNFSWFMGSYRSDGYPSKLYILPTRIGEWKGYDLYAPAAHSKDGKTVILTHGKLLPWRNISQREYLEPLRNNILKNKTVGKDALVKAGQSADNINRFTRQFDDKIAIIDNYLANAGEKTLQQPAIVSVKMMNDFTGSFATLNNGGFHIVTSNEAYFNPSLPRYVPQFIVLYWRWTMEAPSLNFKKEFEDNFPIEKLQAMIDK